MNDMRVTEDTKKEGTGEEAAEPATDAPLIASPCIRVCCLDDADVCLGCFRTLDEIRNWQASSDSTRLHVLDEAERRRRAHDQRFPAFSTRAR